MSFYSLSGDENTCQETMEKDKGELFVLELRSLPSFPLYSFFSLHINKGRI